MAKLSSALLVLLLCVTACTPRGAVDPITPPPVSTPTAEPLPTETPERDLPPASSDEPTADVSVEPGQEDYFLLVDGQVFSVAVAGSDHALFGEPLSSQEEFWPEIYAGTYWLVEHYDGVTLWFGTGPEGIQAGGIKVLQEIDITPPGGETAGPDISTSRGIRLGDDTAAVLAAYPELEGMEEVREDGTATYRLTDEDEIYYLVFYLADNQVAEIAAGANIQ